MLSGSDLVVDAGGRERVDPGDPRHLQRDAGLPRILVDLQHHGRESVQRPVQALHQRRGCNGQLQRRVVAQPVRGAVRSQLHLVQSEDQLRQCAQRIPRPLPSGTLRHDFSINCRLPSYVDVFLRLRFVYH